MVITGLSFRYSRLLPVDKTKISSLSAFEYVRSNSTKTIVGTNGQHYEAQSGIAISAARVATQKYANDRVYCMIPFIWNREIYDVSKYSNV